MAEMSWLYWLTFDGLSAADEVSTPALFVHGDECVLPANVKDVHARLRGEKELVWTGGSQVDFYDQQRLVDKAMAAVVPWFDRTLRKGREESLKVAEVVFCASFRAYASSVLLPAHLQGSISGSWLAIT